MTGKRKTEARRWFQQALYDLKATRWNIEGKFYDTACFIAQQAGEKALKSILYFLGSRRKALMTHSTVEMVLAYQQLEKEISAGNAF
jgi:HEPN domain-containing protein